MDLPGRLIRRSRQRTSPNTETVGGFSKSNRLKIRPYPWPGGRAPDQDWQGHWPNRSFPHSDGSPGGLRRTISAYWPAGSGSRSYKTRAVGDPHVRTEGVPPRPYDMTFHVNRVLVVRHNREDPDPIAIVDFKGLEFLRHFRGVFNLRDIHAQHRLFIHGPHALHLSDVPAARGGRSPPASSSTLARVFSSRNS